MSKNKLMITNFLDACVLFLTQMVYILSWYTHFGTDECCFKESSTDLTCSKLCKW